MKNRMFNVGMFAAAVLAGVLIMAAPASAAVSVSTSLVNIPQGASATNANVVAAWGGHPIRAGNVAQSGTITLLSGGYPYGGNVANLKDGLMVSSVSPPGGPYPVDNTANSAAFDNGANPSQVKLVLDKAYDLARIDVFTSYQWARTGQKWDVFTSTNGGTTWSASPLASVNYTNSTSGGYDSRRVTVSDSGSAAIATNVNALRFDIYDTDTSGGGFDVSVYSEIAVYAVPGQITVSSSVVNLPLGGSSTNANVTNAWGGNPILPGNLAQNASITLETGGYPYGGNVSNLNDGLMISSISSGYILDATANSATFDNGTNASQIKLVLDKAYDLAKIDVFTSYQWTRTGQKWDVFTSTNGGTTWSATPLASVNFTNSNAAGAWASRRVTVQDSTPGTTIAIGVNALRFDIYDTDTSGGGYDISVYSEIAIYGAAVEKWIYKNGQRFFPIGISSYPDGTALKTLVSSSAAQIQEVALAGVNWAWENMNDVNGNQLLNNTMLNRCGTNGIMVSAVAMNWNPDYNWITKDSFHVPGSPFDLAVRDLMNNPYLLNYYGMDEAVVLIGINGWPQGHEPYYPVTYDTLMSAKRFLKSIDPNRPLMYIEGAPDHCVAEFGEQNTRHWVNNITDATGINYYPVRDGYSFPSSDLLLIPAVYLDQMARLTDPDVNADGFTRYNPGRPLIAAWQGGPSSATGPRPLLEEMRANVYSLIIHGAKGLSSWGEGFLNLTNPADAVCWSNYKKVSRELADLQPVLVTDDVAYSFWQATPPPYVPDWRLVQSGGLVFSKNSVIGVVKEYRGDRYLIAMNWGNEDLGTVSITVPGWNYSNNSNRTPVLFEGRSVNSASQTWSDNFGPWAVHIYTDKQIVPAITNAVMLPGGTFQMQLTGGVDQPYRVLGTNNLTAPAATWPVLGSGTFGPGGTGAFTNSGAGTNPQRFYRVVTP